MHIKNNIKYFLDTHFGNLMNEKDDPMTKGVALQGDQLQKQATNAEVRPKKSSKKFIQQSPNTLKRRLSIRASSQGGSLPNREHLDKKRKSSGQGRKVEMIQQPPQEEEEIIEMHYDKRMFYM